MDYFASIESAYEYVALLEGTLAQAAADVEAEFLVCGNVIDPQLPKRKVEYLLAVRHNLAQCEKHMKAGKRCLNNLRRLENIG